KIGLESLTVITNALRSAATSRSGKHTRCDAMAHCLVLRRTAARRILIGSRLSRMKCVFCLGRTYPADTTPDALADCFQSKFVEIHNRTIADEPVKVWVRTAQPPS